MMGRFSTLMPLLLLSACGDATPDEQSPRSESHRDVVPTVPGDASTPVNALALDAGRAADAAMTAAQCTLGLPQAVYGQCATVSVQVPNTCLGLSCSDICMALCRSQPSSCAWLPPSAASPPNTVTCQLGCSAGRRPHGLRPSNAAIEDLGGWFAEAARMEAAAVRAFEILLRDLEAHGAPERLRAAARRAALDEVRHTRMMRVLADRHGGTWEPPVVDAPEEARSLEAIAIENAVEGCVGESFAALLAGWQAEHATDPLVARTMVVIARDEARHADLAWDVHEWAMQKLDRQARARVAAAMQAAARLMTHAHTELTAQARVAAGFPDRQMTSVLIERADQSLWSVAA
jgi:hypothetical protein